MLNISNKKNNRASPAKPWLNGGFTLIELLVVISIIGLLSSIVMASLSDAKAKARDARRLQDVKQLRLALTLYQNDNGGDIPTGTLVITSLNTDFLKSLVDGKYLPSRIIDPINNSTYKYYYIHNPQYPAWLNNNCVNNGFPNAVAGIMFKLEKSATSYSKCNQLTAYKDYYCDCF